MARKWIVTGANGYLGGEICTALNQRGETVHAFSRAGSAPDGKTSAGISWHTYDALPDILAQGDIVVHCAAKVCETGAWEDYVAINIDWTTSLFDHAASAGAACFVHVSSIAALGYGNRPGAAPLDENSKSILGEGELYGRSKLLAEGSLADRVIAGAPRLLILRPGLVYGPGRIASSNRWLRRGVTVDPRQRVPLIHVENFLAALVACVGTESARGVYLVVDEEQPALGDLNRLKLRHGILRHRPWPLGRVLFKLFLQLKAKAGARRRGRALPAGYTVTQYALRVRRLTYSTARLRGDTGWSPEISLEQGLEECARARAESTERPS